MWRRCDFFILFFMVVTSNYLLVVTAAGQHLFIPPMPSNLNVLPRFNQDFNNLTTEGPILTSRWTWDSDWWNITNKYAPQRIRIFNAETGEFQPSSTDTGWSREFLMDFGTNKGSRVGSTQIHGDDRESTGFITTAARGFTEKLVENMHTDVYCRGSIHYSSLFGPTKNKENEKCVLKCLDIAKQIYPHSGNLSRQSLVENLPEECHVPLVHNFKAAFYKTIAQDSPTATVHIPSTVFRRSRINNRKDLIEFLIKVDVNRCPALMLPQKSTDPPLQPPKYKPAKRNFYQRSNFEQTEQHIMPIERTMEPYPQDSKTPKPHWIRERPLSNPFDFIDFKETDQYQGPRFRAAPAVHYSSYMSSTFNGPSQLGHLVDKPVVLSAPKANTFILDIGKTVRRMWDLETISIGILSSCNILKIEEDFVFLAAMNWIYKPESPECTTHKTCAQCRKAGCTWCRARKPNGNDFLDIPWRNISQPRIDGRCGAPLHACVGHYGFIGNQIIC